MEIFLAGSVGLLTLARVTVMMVRSMARGVIVYAREEIITVQVGAESSTWSNHSSSLQRRRAVGPRWIGEPSPGRSRSSPHTCRLAAKRESQIAPSAEMTYDLAKRPIPVKKVAGTC